MMLDISLEVRYLKKLRYLRGWPRYLTIVGYPDRDGISQYRDIPEAIKISCGLDIPLLHMGYPTW